MTVYAGPGPYRPIEDRELRPIFYLTMMRAWIFAIVPINPRYALSLLGRFAGNGIGHALYINFLSNDYYESYVKTRYIELNL